MSLFSKIAGAVAGPLIGGLFGSKDTDKRNEQAAVNQQQEYERQKEFAQMGIRWKAADAKAAGLHPLAAIGSAGASYSPTVLMPESSGNASRISEGISGALQSMGQNTVRAQVATQTATERKLEDLAIRNAELRNSALELELAARTASLLGQPANPPAPTAAGPSARAVGSIKIEPSTQISASSRNAGVEAASTPLTKSYRIDNALGIRLPSKEASEALEGLGFMQHLAGPALIGLQAGRELLRGPETGPPHPSMKWNAFKQQWESRPKSRPGRSPGAGNISDHYYP